MSAAAKRLLVAIDGSPIVGGSVNLLLRAMCDGADDAGGEARLFRCYDLQVGACIACGPEPTTGWCIFHDDMDPLYEAIVRAHAVVVGSPIHFDTVSAPLKMVIDRCNCVTPLVRLGDGGYGFRPKLARTRRGAFVTACGADNRYDMAERTVRGFLKWVGAKWEETLAWQSDDVSRGAVAGDPALLARARALGRRLVESAPLEAAAP